MHDGESRRGFGLRGARARAAGGEGRRGRRKGLNTFAAVSEHAPPPKGGKEGK